MPGWPVAGSILWRKDFGGSEAFTGIEVDPLDRWAWAWRLSRKRCRVVPC